MYFASQQPIMESDMAKFNRASRRASLQQAEMMLRCERDRDGIPEVGRIARLPEERESGLIECPASCWSCFP